MKEKYNVIIVDDEYLAQKLLQDYVSKVDSLQLVATCSNAFEAMNGNANNTRCLKSGPCVKSWINLLLLLSDGMAHILLWLI